ncbi:MAG: Fic family protein [Gammaproteobacteria bacterium]|nr:Fic family protein [Gammaproteobacteria bacterium]
MYIHEHPEWPNFKWDETHLSALLAEVRYLQGNLLGRLSSLGFDLREEATLQTLTRDILKTSEIEGEKLDKVTVRSSIARRLGLDMGGTLQADRHVEGIVEVIIDATRNYDAPLTEERLLGWHAALFPTGRSGIYPITVGAWRTEKSGIMQVVSGAYGHEKVHYEAPSHDRLRKEMCRFINWFNTQPKTDLVLRSAVAHFWFVAIHPFDDGNGRIARAIADMVLARSENSKQRFYSMSSQIQCERNDYYHVLETCQKGTLNITAWFNWFLNCLKRAMLASSKTLDDVFMKARFWEAHAGESFNVRQKIILKRLLDGFEGKLTSSKWAKIGKCSADTALRDIHDLLERKILQQEKGGGRSTSYVLVK